MKTNDLDERLEELALAKGGREYVLTRTLVQALLRARREGGRLAGLMRSSLKFWPAKDHPKPCGEDMCWFCFLEGELESAVEDLETALDPTVLDLSPPSGKETE